VGMTVLSRRRFLVGCTVTVGVALLAACGNGATPAVAPTAAGATTGAAATTKPAVAAATTPQAGAATAAPVTAAGTTKGPITFFARGDDAIFKVFRDLRDAYQKDNAGVKVQIDEVPGDWYQKFQLQLASGTPPDAVFESAGTTTKSARAGALQALDDFMKRDTRFKKEDYWDIAFLPSIWQGKTYHMPYDGGSMALYYNQDLFKAAGVKDMDPKTPLTLEELLDLSKKLTLDQNGKHPGDAGFDPTRIKQYGISPSRGTYWIYAFANGGEIIGQDGTVPLDAPETAAGIQWLADLGSKYQVAPSPEFQQSSPLSFNTGNVAIQYDGVWSSVRYRQNKFAWDVAPFGKGKVKAATGWYSGLSMTTASKAKDTAWDWIFFCCSEAGQKIVSGLGQAVPCVKKLANTDAFLDPKSPPAHKQVFLDEMTPDILRLPGDKFGSPFGGYWNEFGQVFSPIYDPVWLGKKTAMDAGKEARPKLEKLLKTGEVS